MLCSKCGKEVAEGKKFCGYCGQRLVVPDYDDDAVTRLEHPPQPQPPPPPGAEAPGVTRIPIPPQPSSRVSEKPSAAQRFLATGRWLRCGVMAILVPVTLGICILAGLAIYAWMDDMLYQPSPRVVVTQVVERETTHTNTKMKTPTSTTIIEESTPTLYDEAMQGMTLFYSATLTEWRGWPESNTDLYFSKYFPSEGYEIMVQAPPGSSNQMHFTPDVLVPEELGNIHVRFKGYPINDCAESVAIGVYIRGAENFRDNSLMFMFRPFMRNYNVDQYLPGGEYLAHASFVSSDATDAAVLKWESGNVDAFLIEAIAYENNFIFRVNGHTIHQLPLENVPPSGHVGIVLAVDQDGWADFLVTAFDIWQF